MWLTSQLCQLLHVQARGVFGLFRHVTSIKSSSCQHHLPLLIRVGTQKRDGCGGYLNDRCYTICTQHAASWNMHAYFPPHLSCLYSVKCQYWIVSYHIIYIIHEWTNENKLQNKKEHPEPANPAVIYLYLWNSYNLKSVFIYMYMIYIWYTLFDLLNCSTC